MKKRERLLIKDTNTEEGKGVEFIFLAKITEQGIQSLREDKKDKGRLCTYKKAGQAAKESLKALSTGHITAQKFNSLIEKGELEIRFDGKSKRVTLFEQDEIFFIEGWGQKSSKNIFELITAFKSFGQGGK